MKASVTGSCLLLLLVCSSALGVNFTVNQSHDSGDTTCDVTCTLRDAIFSANSNTSDDTIVFAAGLTSIVLADEIGIDGSLGNGTLMIAGPGAHLLTINGGPGTNRIFYLRVATATITGLTLTGGNGSSTLGADGYGGALITESGALTLNRVHITANTTPQTGGGVFFGGGNHQIFNSTFSSNSAENCGGIYMTSGTLAIVSSTISGNTAVGSVGLGAGICSQGTTTLRSTTVTGNTATGSDRCAVYLFGGSFNLGNTIVARNDPAFDFLVDGGVLSTSGFNFIGRNDGFPTAIIFPAGDPNANQDIVGTIASPKDPMLGALANNGGSTPTQHPLANSPVIDRGSSFSVTADQRSLSRPIDLPGYANGAGDTADIGSVEVQLAPSAAAVSITGRVTTADGRALRSSRLTLGDGVNYYSAITNAFGYFRIDDVEAGRVYVLSVVAKQHNFQPVVLVVNDGISDLEIIAQP